MRHRLDWHILYETHRLDWHILSQTQNSQLCYPKIKISGYSLFLQSAKLHGGDWGGNEKKKRKSPGLREEKNRHMVLNVYTNHKAY